MTFEEAALLDADDQAGESPRSVTWSGGVKRTTAARRGAPWFRCKVEEIFV